MDITAVVAVVLIFGMPIAIVIAALITRYMSSRRRYEAMVRAIELGKDPEEVKELFQIEARKKKARANGSSYLKGGIIVAGVGFGLLGMGAVSGDADLQGPGVFLLILGLAFFIIYLLLKPKSRTEEKNQ